MINLISAVGVAVTILWVGVLFYFLGYNNRKYVLDLLYDLEPDEAIMLNGTRVFFYRRIHMGEYHFITYYSCDNSEYHSINITQIKSIWRIK